jgi:glycerophosphoryl diester phosphodiesterase
LKDSPHLQNFPQLNAFHGKPGFISLIGHRGARGLMPENTIEGFEYILDNDIIAIEFDVLLTKDEIPIITHDFYLSKAITRNSEGNWLSKDGPRISDLTSSQLEMFDVGGVDKSSAYGRLYLDLACLPKGQNLFLLLEIKSEPLVKKSTIIENIVFEIEKRSLSNRTVLHSFDWELLEECNRLAPNMPRSYLSQLPESLDDPYDKPSEEISPDFSSFNGSIPEAIEAAGGHLWCPYFKDLTADLVAEAHNLGLPVCTWTVNEVEDIENMIDIGVDGIITDYTDRAKNIFKLRGLRWQ